MSARHSFARIREIVPVPNLIGIQRDSFGWFLEQGLEEVFAERSPMQNSLDSDTDPECGADRGRRSDGK